MKEFRVDIKPVQMTTVVGDVFDLLNITDYFRVVASVDELEPVVEA